MAKNIVVCLDGTGNQFGDANSNVVRLYASIDVKKEQVAYYHPGVGTMGAPEYTGPVIRAYYVVAGLAFGVGFRDTIRGAYEYLMKTYEDGDQVYLFGFSRGSYALRALASAIHVYGLLCPGNEGHLPYLLRMFSKASRDAYGKAFDSKKSDQFAAAFKETFSRPMPIRFLGIWDTVSSIGWAYDPVKVIFDDRNPIVQACRHAVSVDERRCYFQAALWGGALRTYDGSSGDPQDVVQAWFAGVHSDVGGSYPQTQSAPALDAFQWMIAEAQLAGLLLHPEKLAAVLGEAGTAFPDIAGNCAPPTAMWRLHDSLTPAWRVLEFLPHSYIDNNGVKRWQLLPLAHRREVPRGALLHPSLLHRLAIDHDYNPVNLKRDCVEKLTEAPGGTHLPEVNKRLLDQVFSVYRPVAREVRTPATAAIVAGVAVGAIGLAWTLWRKLG